MSIHIVSDDVNLVEEVYKQKQKNSSLKLLVVAYDNLNEIKWLENILAIVNIQIDGIIDDSSISDFIGVNSTVYIKTMKSITKPKISVQELSSIKDDVIIIAKTPQEKITDYQKLFKDVLRNATIYSSISLKWTAMINGKTRSLYSIFPKQWLWYYDTVYENIPYSDRRLFLKDYPFKIIMANLLIFKMKNE